MLAENLTFQAFPRIRPTFSMNLNLKANSPHPYLLMLGAFLVFAGVRVHFIMAYGSQTPYWDDWAMGTRMAMYMDSGFDPTWLYGLANEHRAMFSKITNLLLFKFNHHQWDPYLTMVLDAFMWAASGVFMLSVGYRERANINYWLFTGLIVVLWTYPLSLFNTLSTIQTYLYYMVLFSICGFWLLTYKALSIKWWIGILFVGATCMTTAGGSFAPVAVTAVSIFLAIFSKGNRSQHLITAAVAGVFAIFGLYLVLSQGGAGLSASKSLSAFSTSLFKTLSWPSSDKTWPSIFFILPIVLLGIAVIRKKITDTRIAAFTLMMGGFGILLCIAIAYARGDNGSGPAERYFDFLTIYLIGSALSLMLIQGGSSKLENRLNSGVAILWIIACITAVPYHLSVSKFQLNDRASLVPIQDDIMARFSVTYDPKLFEGRAFREVPFPFPNILRGMVDRIRSSDALPYSLQPSSMALDVKDNAFTLNGIGRPHNSLYKGLENVLGSFNLKAGAQNATGKYVSEVFEARRPYIMVPVSGYLGFNKTSLTLVGEGNGKVVNVAPRILDSTQEHAWTNIIVKAPDDRFRIVAEDNSTGIWFAYAAPRSIGRLSYLVERILSVGDKIWVLGLVILIFAFRRQIVQFVAKKGEQTAAA